MIRTPRVSLFVAISMALSLTYNTAIGAERTADQILKEIDSIRIPSQDLTKKNDRTYFLAFMKTRQVVMDKRGELTLELFKAAPNHQRIAALLAETWKSRQFPTAAATDQMISEIDAILAHPCNQDIKIVAVYHRARAKLYKSGLSGKSIDLSGIKQFLDVAPRDQARAGILFAIACAIAPSQSKSDCEETILADFPNTAFAANLRRERKGRVNREVAVGKPFNLDFKDAISGVPISIRDLRGKVIILDFWATWCGPCVAEIPMMKDFYAKYHDRGVEVIGISLDAPEEKGGLARLREFVKKRDIPWPQYYQGVGPESRLSSALGVSAIPEVWVIDTEGKVYSNDARGKLDVMVPDLLKK
jgi:thiol-disulfide isomerase/thioredoxin